jgi:riboflavin kinase
MIVKGFVTNGKREGGYFLLKEGYARQFREKLGFVPFPGTLNIRTDEEVPFKEPSGVLESFSEHGKMYGKVTFYLTSLRHDDKVVRCYIVRPSMAKEKGIIEIVHEQNLRELLGLEDGDAVELEI